MRLRELGSDAIASAAIDLAGLPIWGAALHGNRLHLVQGKYAEVSWEYEGEKAEWIGHTNNGTVLVSIWDASQLPNLQKTGRDQGRNPPRPGGLNCNLSGFMTGWWFWANATSGSFYGWWRGPVFAGADLVRGVGDAWILGPVVDANLTRAGRRRCFSRNRSGDREPDTVGRRRQSGGWRVRGVPTCVQLPAAGGFRGHRDQRGHRDDLGPRSRDHQDQHRDSPDGTTETEILKDTTGNLWTVTNQYPVLRWWSRYELDVVDFSADAALPVRRPPVTLPRVASGRRQGRGAAVHHGDKESRREREPANLARGLGL
jgi:hypothetical protein